MKAVERKRKQMENLSDHEEVEEEYEESGFSTGKEYSAEESETDSDEFYEYADETQKKKDAVRKAKPVHLFPFTFFWRSGEHQPCSPTHPPPPPPIHQNLPNLFLNKLSN